MKRLLQDYLREQAQRRPEARAVRLGEESLTYGELETSSDRLAAALRAAGCRRGDRVCILQGKSPRALLSIFGALKADCIYLPLDPGNPPSRLLKMVASTKPAVILSDRVGDGTLRKILAQIQASPISIGWIDSSEEPWDLGPVGVTLKELWHLTTPPPTIRTRAEDIAYILFTSGSTGDPKGVTTTHANVVHFIEWAKSYFALGPDDRLSGHPPLHFDLSTFDIYGAVAAGAELHLVPPELSIQPHRLADFIRDSGLTQWFSVPSLLRYLARWEVVRQDDFPALRRLLWCGEVFDTPSLTHWMKRLPHVRFTNLYGPTEATIASSYYTLESCPDGGDADVPIGTALPGEEILVLDDRLKRLPVEEVGELYIRGAGLSPGYWRDDVRTRRAFVLDPVSGERLYRTGDLGKLDRDGQTHFLGRSDTQIKSRGYRIELGEVETALSGLEYLTESAVVAIETDEFTGALICCAYACGPTGPVEPARIRSDLQTSLPGYMIPVRWLTFDRLPRNANGKIDRRELGERFGRREVTAH